jgi:hypothetical protein
LILIFSFFFFLSHTHRLAASEIAKFQDQLIKRLIDDMSSQMETLSPSTGAITVSTHQLTPGVVYDYDWNFARAFLYSLTVLTTIGEFLSVFCLLQLVYELIGFWRRFLLFLSFSLRLSVFPRGEKIDILEDTPQKSFPRFTSINNLNTHTR